MATVTELVTIFSFRGSTGPLNQYNASLGKGIGLLAGMTTALAVTSAAVGKWATGILRAFDATEQLSRSTGVSVEWIQEMGYVTSVTGGSVQGLQSTVESLSQKIGDAAQKGSEDFSRLGISVRDVNGRVKSTEQVLGEVASRFQSMNLSINEQRSFASALGIDPSMLQTLRLGADGIARLRGEARALGVLNSEQADQAIEYNDAVTRLRFGFDGLQRMIAVGLAPQLKVTAERLTQLLVDNRGWIINGVKFAMEFISEFLAALQRLIPVFGLMAAGFVAMKISALGFAGALAVIFSPAVLIAAGITAVLLILDDLIVAFQGGQSVIASFFQEFFNWDIGAAMRGWAETLSTVVGSLSLAWDGFVLNAWNGLLMLKDAITGLLPDWALRLVGVESAGTATGGIGAMLQPGSVGGRVSNQSSTVQQTNNIEIRTSDPERAGRAAADNLQRQLDDAQRQSKRGGF